MEFPVLSHGRAVGSCTVQEQGLYWQVDCSCRVLSDRIERLYCESRRIGVLELEDGRLTCRRRLSKSSMPELPPKSGCFSLQPFTHWQGEVAGCHVSAFRCGDILLFPYDPDKPCPCEPLICFFTIRDGFWQLPMAGTWQVRETETDAL